MKKLIYIILLGIFFTSCEKFLEEKPTALISDATFYKTYEQTLLGISTAYAELRGDDGDVINQEDMVTDIDCDGDNANWIWTSAIHPEVPYNEFYKVISEANVTVEKVRENVGEINASLALSNAPQKLKDSGIDVAKMFEGEARFIRALMYLRLVSYYGDVPLILKSFVSGEIPTDLVRAPKDSVYSQIREDLKFAVEHCATNDLIPSGRVTKAAAAGLLAKMDVYWASITLRDEKYWDKNLLPAAPANQASLRTELYAEAVNMCNKVINGEFGTYMLENYFPAAATGNYFSKEHLFALHARRGDATNVQYHEGWHGGRGRNMTHYAPFLWDFPTWKDEWNSPKKIYDLGLALNDTLIAHNWSLTGDTTRRLWSCLIWRGNPDPPQVVSWMVYEPLARNCGPEHFIPIGLGPKPYSNYSPAHQVPLADNNGDWTSVIWTASGRKITDPEIWRINNAPSGYTSGKFRLPHPYAADFKDGDYEHTYPVLRLAEIYLIRAEANFFKANEVLNAEVIADIDVVRERAQNQAPLRELMIYQGNPPKVIKTGSPKLFRDILPAGISGNAGLKILLDERVRELSNENDVRWLDMARFPQVILPNIHEMSEQEQPLKVGISSGNNYYNTSFSTRERFSVETNLYMLYLPMPESELEFYKGLKQTHGYN